ncbi:MAG: hypothetical protein ACXWL5_01195 [Candidatus Chromulinivorax sp.]
MKINFIKIYKFLFIFALFNQTIKSIDNIEEQIKNWTEEYQNKSVDQLNGELKTLLWYGLLENIVPVKLSLDPTGWTDYYDIDEDKYNNIIENWDQSDFITAIILGTLERNGLYSSLINYDNIQDVKQQGIYAWVLEHPSDDRLYKAIKKEYEAKQQEKEENRRIFKENFIRAEELERQRKQKEADTNFELQVRKKKENQLEEQRKILENLGISEEILNENEKEEEEKNKPVNQLFGYYDFIL